MLRRTGGGFVVVLVVLCLLCWAACAAAASHRQPQVVPKRAGSGDGAAPPSGTTKFPHPGAVKKPQGPPPCPAKNTNDFHDLKKTGEEQFARDRLDAAMSCFFRAMDLVRLTITIPSDEVAEVQMAIGDVFVEMGKPGQAEETYAKVLTKHSRSSNVHFRHFSMLSRVAELIQTTQDKADLESYRESATEALQKAIALNRTLVDYRVAAARWYNLIEQPEQAFRELSIAYDMAPNDPSAYYVLLDWLQSSCMWGQTYDQMLGRLHEFVDNELRGVYRPAGWSTASVGTLITPQMALGFLRPSELLRAVGALSASYAAEAQKYGQPPYEHEPNQMRVGYVSAQFGDTPVGQSISSVLALHDRSKFEVYAYPLTPRTDSLTYNRTLAGADVVFDPALVSLGGLVEQMYETDKLDILVDLDGFGVPHFRMLFAVQAAPIQISFLGWPATTGSHFHQYIVVDPLVAPRSSADHFTEKLISLPNSYYVSSHKELYPQLLRRPKDEADRREKVRASFNIPADVVVFGCFSQLWKIDPELWATWMTILKETDGSYLFLMRWGPKANEQYLKLHATNAGVSPDRIVFADPFPVDQHLLQKRRLVDIVLDPRKHSGLMSTADALWAGIPVITLFDKQAAMVQKNAASVLTAMGLQEEGLIVDTLEAYKTKAVALASDAKARRALVKKIKQSRTTAALFDTQQWVKHWEEGLVQAYDSYHANEPADHIVLTPLHSVTAQLLTNEVHP